MTVLTKLVSYLTDINDTLGFAKAIQDVQNAQTPADQAAAVSKFIAEVAIGLAITPWVRKSLPLVRLGLAITGQTAKWTAISQAAGSFGGDGVGAAIDWANNQNIGGHLYDLLHPSDATASDFNAAARWIAPRRDPLVFDLNGNGIETVPINPTNPILFDHTGSGIKQGTGWIAPTDGFLVLDRNGNGTIDSGRELFGDSTPLASGGNAVDGFAALAAQDTNADGVVNALDANFANLRIWQDTNQDGLSFVDANSNGIFDAGEVSELKTLTELGIASIKVAKTENSQLLPNGNEIADLGTFTRTDGSVGGMGATSKLADVNLASDTFHRSIPNALSTTAVAHLHYMKGRGAMWNFREAENDVEARLAA
jgi:hypothetical protein